jgi:hypothetical protein
MKKLTIVFSLAAVLAGWGCAVPQDQGYDSSYDYSAQAPTYVEQAPPVVVEQPVIVQPVRVVRCVRLKNGQVRCY